MSNLGISYDVGLGMDYTIHTFTSTVSKEQYAEMKAISAEKKSLMLDIMEAGSPVPCKLLHRTTINVNEDNAEKNPEKLAQKLIYLTDPTFSATDDDEERSDKQTDVIVQSASVLLDYLIEAYNSINLEVMTVVPDGTSPDDCDELTFGCGMRLTEVDNKIKVTTVLVISNVLPFYWDGDTLVYDTERKEPVTIDYLKGILRILNPNVPWSLSSTLEHTSSVIGLSIVDSQAPFLDTLVVDDIHIKTDDDSEMPLVFSLRENEVFCAVVPLAHLDMDEALDSEDIEEAVIELCGDNADDEEEDEDEDGGDDGDDEDDEDEDDSDDDSDDDDSDPVGSGNSGDRVSRLAN